MDWLHLHLALNHVPVLGTVFVLLGLAVACGCAKPPAQEPPAADTPPTFAGDIRPLLAVHCFSCHGEGEDLQAGLDLRELDRILAGGISGPAIVPGDARRSLIYDMVWLDEMPPDEQKLTSAEKARLHHWIETGAHPD